MKTGRDIDSEATRKELAFLKVTTKSRHDGLPSAVALEMPVEVASHNTTVRTWRTLTTALWNANPR
jgi:hypothetical protein